MAIDLGPKGIRVNAVCAATIKTPLVDKLFQSFADITHGGDVSAYWEAEAGRTCSKARGTHLAGLLLRL